MTKLLSFLPFVPNPKAILTAVGAAVLAFGLAWGWGLHKEAVGYARGTAEVVSKVEAATATERLRMEQVNKDAAERAAQTIDALEKRSSALNAIIEENARASGKDPRRDAAGLGAGSVQRLKRIR